MRSVLFCSHFGKKINYQGHFPFRGSYSSVPFHSVALHYYTTTLLALRVLFTATAHLYHTHTRHTQVPSLYSCPSILAIAIALHCIDSAIDPIHKSSSLLTTVQYTQRYGTVTEFQSKVSRTSHLHPYRSSRTGTVSTASTTQPSAVSAFWYY